jgi:hypothetical protein
MGLPASTFGRTASRARSFDGTVARPSFGGLGLAVLTPRLERHVERFKKGGLFDSPDFGNSFSGMLIFETFKEVGSNPIRMMEANPVEDREFLQA